MWGHRCIERTRVQCTSSTIARAMVSIMIIIEVLHQQSRGTEPSPSCWVRALPCLCHHFSKVEGSTGLERYIGRSDNAKHPPNTGTMVLGLGIVGAAILWWPRCTPRPSQRLVVYGGCDAFNTGVPGVMWHFPSVKKSPFTRVGHLQIWLLNFVEDL